MARTAFIVAPLAILTPGGCIDRADYESTPVQVKTAKGTVTCQLYTTERVLWDEAVSAPAGMTIAEADEVCRQEGFRRKNAG